MILAFQKPSPTQCLGRRRAAPACRSLSELCSSVLVMTGGAPEALLWGCSVLIAPSPLSLDAMTPRSTSRCHRTSSEGNIVPLSAVPVPPTGNLTVQLAQKKLQQSNKVTQYPSEGQARGFITKPGPHSNPLICPPNRLRQITPQYTDSRWDNVSESNNLKYDPVRVR
ncbi:hypothetical protein TREES_T100014781 [Tupaia chinensis]|uniref:Uncharacterized protein n=1 Tax=Tupaia chinensis TaxID=246437 RepID=L9KYH9_TUPCH|nr:hypothetical protein TREES_T100014781 [Tupaia chinensis]